MLCVSVVAPSVSFVGRTLSRQERTIENLTEVVKTQANTIAALVAAAGRKGAPVEAVVQDLWPAAAAVVQVPAAAAVVLVPAAAAVVQDP